MSEEELLSQFIEATMVPAEGMSIYQTINLLRHILQDKMGERFASVAALGTPAGAKRVANEFESIVLSHLEELGVAFKTEETIVKEWKQENNRNIMAHYMAQPDFLKKAEATISQYVAKEGDLDSRGRQLYSGPCFQCTTPCSVPFKPRAGPVQMPPLCQRCQRDATTTSSSNSNNNSITSESNSSSSSSSSSNRNNNSDNNSDSSSSGGTINSPAPIPNSSSAASHLNLLSPDFLFPSKLTINGFEVAWLDCKCFYGNASTALTSSKMAQQALKYNNRFGPGAIVFAFGFCSALDIKDVTILDASQMDLSSLQEAIITDANPKQIEAWYRRKINEI
jgi:hypothetical protein